MTPPMRPPTPQSEPSDAPGSNDLSAAQADDRSPVTAPPPAGPPGALPAGPPAGHRARHQPQARLPRRVVYAVIAVVLLLLVALVGAVVLSQSGGGAARGHTVTAARDGAEQEEFQLISGVTSVNVRTEDLGGDLYRISTPRNSDAVPRVFSENGRIELDVTAPNGNASTSVDVRLNSAVRWQIGLIGGSASATVDVRNAHITGVDFTGGVNRAELWLPRPQGRVAIRMAGGGNEFTVHVPNEVPSRVHIGAGASTVTIDGERHSGIAPGTAYAPTGWDQAADRYDLDATAGLATLSVERY
ncbi:MAG TPA: hypothetical protein VK453_19345 [Micromonosporaceae bacterium]|nr:hypothetical protein [Micromonosporaceae bacterium]